MQFSKEEFLEECGIMEETLLETFENDEEKLWNLTIKMFTLVWFLTDKGKNAIYTTDGARVV